MIRVEEIPVERIEEFWTIHLRYLMGDAMIDDEEDVEYFSGDEYRDIIKAHMMREKDRHHMVYFVDRGRKNVEKNENRADSGD